MWLFKNNKSEYETLLFKNLEDLTKYAQDRCIMNYSVQYFQVFGANNAE